MPETPQTISLPSLYGLLRRQLIPILVIVLIAVGASVVISLLKDPSYEATASIGFNDESGDLQALGIPAAQDLQPEKQAAAQAERVQRPDVIRGVAKALALRMSFSEIQSSVSTEVEPSSNLVRITATADSGELAARLANGFAAVIRQDTAARTRDRYRAVAQTAQQRAARLDQPEDIGRRAVYEDQAARLLALASFADPVDVVRAAEVPDDPSSPKPVRDAILAGLLGLILGCGVAFLRQAFDRRVRDQAGVEALVSMPVVGSVRSAALGHTPFAVSGEDQLGDDEDVEPFRILRTNLSFLKEGEDVRTVVVTSALAEEGKSTVALGLAWAEALTGRRTLLVDCDLRRPTVASRLGLDATPGLSDFLVGAAEPGEVLRTLELPGVELPEEAQLVCIPAGRAVANHAELLDSERFRSFLADAAAVYDRIVLDSAPLLPVSDTLGLVPQVDAVLLCVRLNQTRRDEVQAADATLKRFPARPTGVVLTAADTGQSPYYVGSYSYAATATEAA